MVHPGRISSLVQRQRCPRMIQTTRLVHHVLVRRRRDLVRLTIVHRPHRPDQGTEPSKLHRRREMNDFVRALFVSYSRMTCREIRKFRVLEIATDDLLDCKVPVVESERGLEGLYPTWETMARKVDPFVLAKLFNDLAVQDSSPSIRVNVARLSTRCRTLSSSTPTERSPLSPAGVA